MTTPTVEEQLAELKLRCDGFFTMIGQLAEAVQHHEIRVAEAERAFRLETLYRSRRRTGGSTNEHMDTLRRYASRCEHVTEFGTNSGSATIALLAGHPQRLVTYDTLYYAEDLAVIADVVRDYTSTSFLFHQASTLDLMEIEPTDLLFIDTLHDYAQLKAELARHGNQARRFLIFHDTVSCGNCDETAHAVPPPVVGLLPAIAEFVAANPHWQFHEHYEHQYGLTIYRREGG